MTRPRPNPTNEFPPDYQTNDLRFIFTTIGKGESCSLMGMGSVGKSNLMRHFHHDYVKEYHLKESEAQRLLTVLLDPHALIAPQGTVLERVGSVWAGYELMLSRLLQAIQFRNPQNMTDELVHHLEELIATITPYYHKITEPPSDIIAQMGLRQVENAIYYLMYNKANIDYKLVFLFDELEEFFRLLPPIFFQSLRAIRDTYKGKIMFVTASRFTPRQLVQKYVEDGTWSAYDAKVVEAFTELLHNYQHYVGLLDAKSFRYNMQRYIERERNTGNTEFDLPKIWRNLFYTATGGHAGLVRRSFKSFVVYTQIHAADATIEGLSNYCVMQTNVVEECQILYESLDEDERRFVEMYIAGQPTERTPEVNRIATSIANKNIFVLDTMTETFALIPIFEAFMRSYPRGYDPIDKKRV